VPSYRIELHSHCQGDPVDRYLKHTIYELIDRAVEVGLDAIAVTWHRKICSDTEAFAYGRSRNVLVIPGMEADVDRKHLILLNVAEGDLPGETTWEEVEALRARKPEVFIIAPHPFYPHPCCLGKEINDHIDCIDAAEWCIVHVHWLPDRISPNLRAERWAHRHGKTLIACSDAHTLEAVGKNASTVEADALTMEAIFAGLRARRVSFHRRSLQVGPLIHQTGKALASQPRHIGRWMQARLSQPKVRV